MMFSYEIYSLVGFSITPFPTRLMDFRNTPKYLLNNRIDVLSDIIYIIRAFMVCTRRWSSTQKHISTIEAFQFIFEIIVVFYF